MSGNDLAKWRAVPSHHFARTQATAGFDHTERPGWALRLMPEGWAAWRTLYHLCLERVGDDWRPRHFPSAAAGARYLEEHPDAD